MHSKDSIKGDASTNGPVRTSGRPKRKPKLYGRTYIYYPPTIFRTRQTKKKTRPASSRIVKMLHKGTHQVRATKTQPVATDLRRSTRQRRVSVNLEGFTDSSGSEDEDLMRPRYQAPRKRVRNGICKDGSSHSKHKKSLNELKPRRAGLRPRQHNTTEEQLNSESGAEQDTSEEKRVKDEAEDTNETDENDADDGQNDVEAEDEGDREVEGDDEGEEDNDDDEGEEEQEGRRRYDLRNRADVRRMTLEGKPRPQSPRRVLHQGIRPKMGKDARKNGSRGHKRHRFSRTDDSDDSLLVDELEQGPVIPWQRGGGRHGPPWLFGGLDIHGTTSWGLNIAASGWGHQGDSAVTWPSGVQTAGPSSKGGADIQPLQVDENVSFDDIGGLSEYVDALKEMVFFPLLYPDFFESYHITPPRGVLLCGPPGTGKTLIARALACAASKAGQKVSFYMRKGADVLSKWVGEAERQLKLLFEEAQRNQPSIIFFDEIDGLAPVRSSKQEQIHNSIVSTLLALMDGLDSRGQVVLIGATNRVDAIDSALRRPGRFDREFNFPLPGCEARAEILDIHTRKWKHPPSKELKEEMAASCVGYCGADLKALCTEAAIRAFREKYPQVYTSDDKFLIDVNSVVVQKYHFTEAMSTITPAAHRGVTVHSRPLSLVVAPCLQKHLRKVMDIISDIFPPLSLSSGSTRLSILSYGSSIPLVYRPRLLLHGGEGCGLDHLGPAILHELEKFPVHSLGLPSLLSDPSAKTPEEALVHIFGEARRTSPSILYIPQFDIWWDNAHEQLRAVMMTMLDELPSDMPILLLGTSSDLYLGFSDSPSDPQCKSIFPGRSIYQVDKPSMEDRCLFFERLVEAASSVLLEAVNENASDSSSLPELPRAPKVTTGPKPSEIKAKVEAEQHALRRLRMCMRDVCNRILYDKRFSAFHYPVTEDDAPNYNSVIEKPMDMATLLQRVDSGQYITCSAFLQDVDLIVENAEAYNGNDYSGTRIVSRAHELRDAVHGMLSQMDPSLVAFCDKIAEQGGPSHIPDDISGSILPSVPVVQIGSATRASARLRNVQPDVNLDITCEAPKRSKRNTEYMHAEDKSLHQETRQGKPTQEATSGSSPSSSPMDCMHVESSRKTPSQADSLHQDGELVGRMEPVKRLLVERTENYGVPQLERLYTRIMKAIFEIKHKGSKDASKISILRFLSEFAEDEANF